MRIRATAKVKAKAKARARAKAKAKANAKTKANAEVRQREIRAPALRVAQGKKAAAAKPQGPLLQVHLGRRLLFG
jgi:hypothetical protein